MVDATLAEEWRAVEGHPGYEVSSLGRVRSTDRWVATENGQNRFYRGKIIVPWKGEYGHLSVALGRRAKVKLGPLVCTVFNGPRPTPAHETAHWNGDPSDNRPANLRWVTSKENKADMLRHGTRVRGEQIRSARLTEAQVAEIRRLYFSGTKQQDIADKFQIKQGHVSSICSGRLWAHSNK